MIDKTIPLAELHRHLDGSIRLGTIIELADQHGIELLERSLPRLRSSRGDGRPLQSA